VLVESLSIFCFTVNLVKVLGYKKFIWGFLVHCHMMRSLFWGVGLDATRGRAVLVHSAGITEIRKGFSNFQVRVLLRSVSLASSRDEPGLQTQLVDFTLFLFGEFVANF